MPGNYAHFRFGSELLPTLPPEVRRTVGRFRQLYDMGLHGPDLLRYHDPLIHDSTVKLCAKYHDQTGVVFFERVCRAVRLNPSEGAMAYLYGVLAHYVLDSMSHPFIRRMVESGKATHNQIETEFDRYLLVMDGKSPAHLYDQTPHMRLTPGECETVAIFYPNVRASAVERSVKLMKTITQMMTVPRGTKRDLLGNTLRMVAPGAADTIIPLHPDPACKDLDDKLLRLYDMAIDRYLLLLEEIQDHLRRKTPLSTDFSLSFA